MYLGAAEGGSKTEKWLKRVAAGEVLVMYVRVGPAVYSERPVVLVLLVCYT